MVTQLNKFTKMHCSVQSLSHVQLFATYELQHARSPSPSPTPRVYPKSCPLNRWCHPTISSSVIPFSSCPEPFPASGSLQMSQLFASGGQSIGVSFSASVLPMSTWDWSLLEWTGWISLQSKELSRVFSNTTVQKLQLFGTQVFYSPALPSIHDTGKTIASTRWNFVDKVMSLVFNMLSRLVITFLSRSKLLLNSWLQSPSEVILEPSKIKSDTVSTVSRSICHKVMGPDAMVLVFWMLSFKPTFSLSSFTFIKRHFHSSLVSAIRGMLSAYLRLMIFLPAILIPAYASSSPAFLMIHSAYKLNKQGDSIQPWYTPFPIWNQSVVPWPVLTVASWPSYRFLKRQVRWSGIPISFRIFQFIVITHTQSKALA